MAGRPRRELPEGIGEEKDIVVALRDGVSEEAIRSLRYDRGIPPASEPHRSRWEARTGRDADAVCALIRAGKWD